MSEERKRRNAGPHRGPGAPHEKPKDLTGTWKKIIGYNRKDGILLIVALCCAVVATVFTLLGPNKLGDLTNLITDGIKPDTDKMQEVVEDSTENMQTNMKDLTSAITANLQDTDALQKNMSTATASSSLSADDAKTLAAMAASGNMDITSLSDDALDVLLNPVTVNDQTFSGSEQIELINALKSMQDASEKDMDITALTDSLSDKALDAVFTEITVDDVKISGDDQLKTFKVLSKIDMNDTDQVMKQLEKLPDSVYGLIRPSIDMNAVKKIVFFLITIYAAGFVLNALQGWITASVTQRLSKKLRSDISVKINRLHMSWYNRHSTGDVMSVVTNDVDTIGQSINQSLSTFVSAIVLFLGSLIMMLITDVRMTLAAVASCFIGFILLFIIMGHSQKYFTAQQKDLGALNGYIEENYTGHTVIKAYNGEEKAENTFTKLNTSLRNSGLKAQCLAGLMQPLMAFIGNLGYVVVCITGGVLTLNGDIEFGVIVSFMLYVRYFTQPLGQIAQSLQSMQSAAAAGERVFGFLEEAEMPDESNKTAHIEKAKGYVDFDHVRFRYDGASHDVIHDFSAHVEPGQKIAIVGPTGAGKTTMVNLLMRFYDLEDGEIRIDGIPTQNMKREDVHSQFCMVLQDTWLFEGTVRENLVYNTPDVSQEKIDDACKAVGLDHFIRTLPHGYDTVLNDETGLSAGQKQQLTIARAMIADKPMLILDEATSSVDTRTELQIQSAMDQLMENRTSFVIAHRLSTIRDADMILVVRDGNIVEKGTHEELLAKNGFYADLYNSQFQEA